MEIKEYQTYNEQEIIDLYQSVGWTNYTSCPETLKEAYKTHFAFWVHLKKRSSLELFALSVTVYPSYLFKTFSCFQNIKGKVWALH